MNNSGSWIIDESRLLRQQGCSSWSFYDDACQARSPHRFFEPFFYSCT